MGMQRFEKLYHDREDLEQRRKWKKEQLEADEMRKLPFRPRLRKSSVSEAVQGRLRVRDDPTGYLDRTTMQIAHKEFERCVVTPAPWRRQPALLAHLGPLAS